MEDVVSLYLICEGAWGIPEDRALVADMRDQPVEGEDLRYFESQICKSYFYQQTKRIVKKR